MFISSQCLNSFKTSISCIYRIPVFVDVVRLVQNDYIIINSYNVILFLQFHYQKPLILLYFRL